MPVYCDALDAWSLAKLAWSHRTEEDVRCFAVSPRGERLARLLVKARILRRAPRPARFQMADITDAAGENQFFVILNAVMQACIDAGKKDFSRDPFIQAYGRSRDAAAFVRFLSKALNEELIPVFAAIAAIRCWHPPEESPLLLLRRSPGNRHAAAYGRSRGIAVAAYPAPDFAPLGALLQRLGAALARRCRALLGAASQADDAASPAQPADGEAPRLPVVANWYPGQRITFDRKTRTAFYWLLDTPVPKEQVLLYFNRRDIPLNAEGAACLRERGVRTLALDPQADATGDAPLWRPGALYAEQQKRSVRAAALALLESLAHGSLPAMSYGFNALRFGHHYAYWREFFARQGIRVSVSAGDFSQEYLAKNLALRDCGGVSVSYQFSNLWAPSLQMSSCSDVMFCFGPGYRPFWEANDSSVRYLVYTGYLSDYSFKPNQPDAARLRSRLQAAGARRVACFFDENSSDDPLCIISNSRSAEAYRAFLGKVLADPCFGLICKPGYPRTLRQRLGPEASALIDRARATGRCVFLEDGAYVTDCYPTLAAQAADVCVGLLLSGTASLEAFLSGTPTVFLDLEKLRSNPVYPDGKGRIVFDSVESLLAGLDAFFADKAAVPGFGDLSAWVKDKDPFKDGRAAERAGSYIGLLYQAFAQGRDREAALAAADAGYREKWGPDSVAELRPGGAA